jgi:glycosyltransferase involved in cell wall biosynthesis
MFHQEERSCIVVSSKKKIPEKLTIVVPCYNEEEVLKQSTFVLVQQIEKMIHEELISSDSLLLFVDDGSKDDTWNIIKEISQDISFIIGIKLSRNVGHQSALLAGLNSVQDGLCISIDADLQDSVESMEEMIKHYYQGCEVVYGVRDDRSTDTFFKRTTASIFYRLMTFLGVETVENHADYRLLGPHALKAVLSFTEENFYLRGIVPLVGFKSACVYYARTARMAGESKYPLIKMLGLALRGITSSSILPLRFIAFLGIIVFLFGLITASWSFIDKIFFQPTIGWASLNAMICLIGGLQMLALGVVGEYIGCIYTEVKRRPRFFIEETLSHNMEGEKNH